MNENKNYTEEALRININFYINETNSQYLCIFSLGNEIFIFCSYFSDLNHVFLRMQELSDSALIDYGFFVKDLQA